MKKRIYGIETEYGIVLIGDDGAWSCDTIKLNSYFNRFFHPPSFEPPKHEFQKNGSRIYLDVGFHPEYCTAECASLLDLIAQDKAGEKILNKIFSELIFGKVGAKKVLLFKNNVQYGAGDDNPEGEAVTFGCHENFLIERKLDVETLEKVLVPFLVARQIFSGAGWVANKIYQSQGVRYNISQRARFIGATVSDVTHMQGFGFSNRSLNSGGSMRAILCTARLDEPHADPKKYQRLHLILGDSNLSELSTYLKMGTVGILLEMIEEGYPFDNWVGSLMPKNPVEALQLVSQDLTCKKPVIELMDGRFISAVDLLWEYIFMISRYENIQGLSPEFADVRKKLIDTLWRFDKREINPETLMEENSQGLDEEIDWLIKKAGLENALRSFNCHWNNFYEKTFQLEDREVSLYDQLRTKDLKYHDTSGEGLYYLRQPNLKLSELRAFEIRTPRMVEEEKIIEMMDNPPQNTRAKLRGDFIKLVSGRHLPGEITFKWNEIYCFFRLSDRVWRIRIDLSDPFLAENTKLAKLSSLIENGDLSTESLGPLADSSTDISIDNRRWGY